MLGPVHWGSFAGEYLEQAMAVMVAQEHPETLRRVPASGDGGIDLMVPDGAGYEVRQVKRFTGRIEINERRQIKESWETLRRDPRLSRPITAYRLVVPVDSTPDEQKWFEDLVKDAPWPASWLGEVHWHVLASKHPHVIDYFFGSGRDRIARRSIALQSAIVDPTRVSRNGSGLRDDVSRGLASGPRSRATACAASAGLIEEVAVAIQGESDGGVTETAGDGEGVDVCGDEVGDVGVTEVVEPILGEWIECWYNPTRRHSSTGMLSPVDYETANTAAAAA